MKELIVEKKENGRHVITYGSLMVAGDTLEDAIRELAEWFEVLISDERERAELHN